MKNYIKCESCDSKIFEGEYYYPINGTIFCDECLYEIKQEVEVENEDY